MTLVAIILGAILVNVILAYVPIILIVGYNLRPKKPKDDLLHAYVIEDSISTDEFVAEVEEKHRGVKHIPLRLP